MYRFRAFNWYLKWKSDKYWHGFWDLDETLSLTIIFSAWEGIYHARHLTVYTPQKKSVHEVICCDSRFINEAKKK